MKKIWLSSVLASAIAFPFLAFAENSIEGSIINNTNDLIYSNPETFGFPITVKKSKTESYKYIVVPTKGEATTMQILYRVKSTAAVVCTLTFSWNVAKDNTVTFNPIVTKGKCSKAADNNVITID